LEEAAMAWLWSDDEEYLRFVQPIQLDRPLPVRLTNGQTWFSIQTDLREAAVELKGAVGNLKALGFGKARVPNETGILQNAREFSWQLVRSGELLLLYHKRLAISDWADDFLAEHDIDTHWVRYAETRRIFLALNDLTIAAETLLKGYRRLEDEDNQFLRDIELSAELCADFSLCRNLFSVGFEEMGLFAAGRGLEGVMRALARRRKLTLKVKGKDEPLQDATFHDLCEAFGRIRLAGGALLIDKQMRSLLDFTRNIRNAAAHPCKEKDSTARELTGITATTAKQLWKKCKGSRFVKLEIIKDW
jgi:hypothetical protein